VPSENGTIVPIIDIMPIARRKYRLTDFVARPDKKARYRLCPPHPQRVELIRNGKCRRPV
jgi:hypothetical protein